MLNNIGNNSVISDVANKPLIMQIITSFTTFNKYELYKKNQFHLCEVAINFICEVCDQFYLYCQPHLC